MFLVGEYDFVAFDQVWLAEGAREKTAFGVRCPVSGPT